MCHESHVPKLRDCTLLIGTSRPWNKQEVISQILGNSWDSLLDELSAQQHLPHIVCFETGWVAASTFKVEGRNLCDCIVLSGMGIHT